MSDVLSFAELDQLDVAPLPARTVMSLWGVRIADSGDGPDGSDGADNAGPHGQAGHPGAPGDSIQGSGKTITYDPAGKAGAIVGG